MQEKPTLGEAEDGNRFHNLDLSWQLPLSA